MTDKQYHDQEMKRAHDRIQLVEKSPLKDKREACQEWTETLKLPDVLTRNTEWLLDGNYGHGEMLLALGAISGKRNKIAGIVHLLAAFDDLCPASFSTKAWKSLGPEEQQAADSAILLGIENYLKAKEEERQENSPEERN